MYVSLATEPGTDGRPNEDWVVATSALVVVLDGLTAPAALGTGCLHGTPWYVRMLAAQISQQVANAPERPLTEALRDAIGKVADAHRDTCDIGHPGTPSATVAVMQEGVDEIRYLVLSDATVIIDSVSGLLVVNDDRVESVAKDKKQAVYDLSIDSPVRPDRLAELITVQRQYRNRPGGYWVAAAEPAVADQALTGSVLRRDAIRACVVSDGAARLVDVFKAASWPDVLDLLVEHGPAELLRRIREVEAADPGAQRWQRYKRADDATAVLAVF